MVKGDPGAHTQPLGYFFQAGPVRATAQDVHGPRPHQFIGRMQQNFDTLLFDQPAHIADNQRGLAGTAGVTVFDHAHFTLADWAIMAKVNSRINPKLRDEVDWAGVPFPLPDLLRFAAANQQRVGVGQNVLLHQVKRGWITLQHVLPAKDNRFGLNRLGQPHCLEGGQIVWFLVDVDDIGFDLAYNLPEFGPMLSLVKPFLAAVSR